MHAKIYSKAIIIEGIHTHTYASTILSDLRDILHYGGKQFSVFFEGSPSPSGSGITIKILINKDLSDFEIDVLQKYFKLRKIKTILLPQDSGH